MEQVELTEAEKLAKFKQQKKEAAVRFKERRAKEAEERVVKAKELINELKDKGYWDDLDSDSQNFITGLAVPKAGNVSNGSTFSKMFGDSPKVGDSVTLEQAFLKTLKGKGVIDSYVKRWAEQGIVVEFKADPENMIKSTYTIVELGSSSELGEDAE